MPRSIWNGTITLGLIAVPVKVHAATENRSVHFRQVHAKDGARIKQRRVCSKDGEEVPYKHVANGYERSDGDYVLLSGDEIAAAAGDGAHRIALDEFVDGGDIDPDFFAQAYYLGAGADGRAAYRLLHDALARTGRVGLGRWVFHNREYLVAVRAHEDLLMLHTMRFADELVDPAELEIEAPKRAPTPREVKMAAALVDSLHDSFRAQAFKDTYREQLLDLIKRKAKGKKIALPKPTEPEAAPDLMAALEASLDGRKPASKPAKRSKRSGAKAPKSSKSKAKG